MSSVQIEGIVLSRINFGEADRLLTIFSREQGKVKVLAKGSRKIKSKMASHIEPFSLGKYFLVEGKTFYILAGAEAVEQNEKIMSDLEIYKDACYVAEILSMTIYENSPSEKLFKITKEVFLNLPSYPADQREIILRFFEYKLLESSGYKPSFRKCLKCGKDLGEKDVYIGTFEGVHCCTGSHAGMKISKNTLKALRLFGNDDIYSILRVKNLPEYNSNLKEVLLPFLYDILPKTPKARIL